MSAAAFPRYDFYGGPGRRVVMTGSEHSRLLIGRAS